ncbi:MAG: Uma2 family endonuclease [Leptolyngbya foveolarum]|uniref:Uma2 family endonuclease n=1 Tax=Leptolyngbya foveolarum TaxID=47253 RepID=A0A2W4TTK9_9CYAN|nr:MAG: Uma2 family endonuclease [Leptolyngbya foveolarum]
MQSPTINGSLDSFLRRSDIEGSPAWEFVDGQAIQKVGPTLFHSLVQLNLMNAINERANEYEALQELRCIVSPFSAVPDISVIAIDRISEEDGPFIGSPDWIIEILLPEDSKLTLQTKALHLLGKGAALVWLIDIQQQQIWVWQREDLPQVHSGDDNLPTLDIFTCLTVKDVMSMTQRRQKGSSFNV